MKRLTASIFCVAAVLSRGRKRRIGDDDRENRESGRH